MVVEGAPIFSSTKITILGVLNLTPDSFSDGGRFLTPSGAVDVESAVKEAEALVAAGADILDVGGESTRPGADEISVQCEIERTLPVIEALAKRVSIPISIDTRKAQVAEAALNRGATLVNDVSGLLHDANLGKVVAAHDAWIILGHLRGNPRTMQDQPRFADVVNDVAVELQEAVVRAETAGIPRDRIVVDPGLGFGKTAEDTLRLLANVGWLRQRLGLPLMIGASRKSFLGAVTGAPVHRRESASGAANAIGIFEGADAIRVHDVCSSIQVAKVASALRGARREIER